MFGLEGHPALAAHVGSQSADLPEAHQLDLLLTRERPSEIPRHWRW
jgi:hypothetical protein